MKFPFALGYESKRKSLNDIYPKIKAKQNPPSFHPKAKHSGLWFLASLPLCLSQKHVGIVAKIKLNFIINKPINQ